MKRLNEFIYESSGKYVNNITKEGKNKISIEDNLEGGINTCEVNVKYFTKPKDNRQAIIVDLGEGKYMDFFKNGNYPWEPLTYFEEDEDPKEIWKENDFDESPDWFTKDTLPKSWEEVEKVLKLNKE